MIKIKRIHHMGINTIDFEKTYRFYTELLGCKLVKTVEDGGSTTAYLELPCGEQIGLFDHHGKTIDRGDYVEFGNGYRHLALEVEDVPKQEAYLRENGVEIILPTTPLPHLQIRVMLFLDPSGTCIEFLEPFAC